MTETYYNYIDGDWIESTTENTFSVRNPADLDDTVGRFQQSDAVDADRAIEAAVRAQPEWEQLPGPDRGSYLREIARHLDDSKTELAEALTREEGKTLPEATGEVQRAVDIFYYYAEKARDYNGQLRNASSPATNLSTRHEPLGTVALITPWNYPIAIPAWKLAPALATGNTVVFKPASQAPNVSRLLFECFAAADLPDGVANYVTGPGSEVGHVFTTDDRIDAVSFTGSAEIGSHVYENATADQKRVQTEMGGKNPALVLPNADIDEAIDIVGAGAFGVTGQACTATSRAIVHEAIHDEFLGGIVSYADSIEVGAGLDGADMGQQVSEGELDTTLDYIDIASGEGATLETGGEELDTGPHARGHFVEPTVFSDVTPTMRIAQEEVFGPVLAVISVGDFEEALAIANDSEYGLSASIVTDDHTEANRFVDEIEAGVVKVNAKTTGLELHVPFGGMKRSSSGTYREQGDAALDFFTTTKTVYDNY